MTLFDSPAFEGHESVQAFHDAKTGLQTIIAVHSTVRGPAAGGCRMWPYPTSEAALDDALRLSRAMSYKNAMADIALGGGKSVIIGDSRTMKTPELFEAFGRAVEAVGGRYWAAEDVGTSPGDMAHARRATRFVAGLDGHPAASGDPSPLTAEGVFRGLALAVKHALGCDVGGLTVAIQGVGHVGAALAEKLHQAGAKLIVADMNPDACGKVAASTGAAVVAPDAIFDVEAQVFSPCALGGAVNARTLERLKAKVVAGGANNQMATADVARAAFERGLVYAPDYVINGGGIINVAAEISALQQGKAYEPLWVAAKIDRLMQTLDAIFKQSRAEGRPTNEIADEIARSRIAESRLSQS